MHCGCADSRRRAAAAEKRRAVQQQLNASQRAQYSKDGSSYMSMKCDNRSLYPYAVSVAAGTRMLACDLRYDAGDADAYSWRSNVDNDYAYVDELLPPQPAPTSHHPSPPHHFTATADNNNACRQQSVPDHVTGCLLACRPYDMATDDRPRVDAGNN